MTHLPPHLRLHSPLGSIGTETVSEAAHRSAVADLAGKLRETAVERDRAGGHAAAERELIRASGLLRLSVPERFGGSGAPWTLILEAVRELARVDSALAHVFGFHHLQLAGVQLYGSEAQQAALLSDTVRRNLFWGNALNPLDKRVVAADTPKGFRLDGVKSFASGSVGSDMLTISAWHAATQTALIAAVPTDRDGIEVEADWDAFGQRQTDSGNVGFNAVELLHAEVLQQPGVIATPRATLRSQVAQLVMANLYLGIGLGAFEEASRYTREQARPWFASGQTSAEDDPFIQHRYGNLWLLLRPAIAVADQAGIALDTLLRKGDEITARERGELAVTVAEAKCLAHHAGIETATRIFDVTGARSTSERHGFDRFWRNVRVHTLHDPIDYKLRDIGRFVLSGRLPEPTAYS